MQPKSDFSREFSDFSDRTDALAAKVGCRIVDLPGRLKISGDMLMGYRTGRYPISNKAWKKLEAAEIASGVGPTVLPAASLIQAPADDRPPLAILLERWVRENPDQVDALRQVPDVLQQVAAAYGAAINGMRVEMAQIAQQLTEARKEIAQLKPPK